MTTFLEEPTPFLFFTGKGGSGKTSLACATAIRLAEAGKLVLLVSTDPASDFEEVLSSTLTNFPAPIAGVANLWALIIDPERAATAYRDRVITPLVPLATPVELAQLRAKLAGPTIVEVGVLDEFVELLAGGASNEAYDHVVFDMAPFGHALRLLRLPREWAAYLHGLSQGVPRRDPHAALKEREPRFAAAANALVDPSRTTVVLVVHAEALSLREASRSSRAIEALGMTNQHLVVNSVFSAEARADAIALALEARGAEALRAMPDNLASRPTVHVPLRPYVVVGLVALRALLSDKRSALLRRNVSPHPIPLASPLAKLIDELERPGRGLVIVVGKGGVGKTTIAASIAVELASRGRAVTLSTIDPSAHVAETVDGDVANLTLARIDAAAEAAAYREREMAIRSVTLDDAGRALVAEELRSPLYEDVAVTAAFVRTIFQARESFVVLDTPPAGQTLLLLASAASYSEQAESGELVTPLAALQDLSFTKVIIVTLAEPTPVAEAARVQSDLRRVSIEPFSWVINATLAVTTSRDPCLKQRIQSEMEQTAIVLSQHATRLAVVPWMIEEPIGPARLLALARGR